MHPLIDYSRRLWRWIASLWQLLLALGVPAAFLLLLLLAGATEPRLRIGGMVFELLGLLAVALGLRETRRFFGLPSLRERAGAVLRAFPTLRRKEIIGTSVGSLGAATATGEMTVWHGPDGDQSVEARLRAAEQNLLNVHNSLVATRTQLKGEIAERKRVLDAEVAARSAENLLIREQLKLAHTGGLDLSATGALWLAIGLVLSTASAEILRLLT